MSSIIFVRKHTDIYGVVIDGDQFFGTVTLDGRWYFYPGDDVRLDAFQLGQIADKLNEMNKGIEQ